jgi:hypothetical protein
MHIPEQRGKNGKETAQEYGGVIGAGDALQPEGTSGMLYVLYEVLSGKPVGALQREHVSEKELVEWLEPYRILSLPILATPSDGENTLIAALKTCWPQAPHQRCQVHFLNNLDTWLTLNFPTSSFAACIMIPWLQYRLWFITILFVVKTWISTKCPFSPMNRHFI